MKSRSEVTKDQSWDLTSLFASFEEWGKKFDSIKEKEKYPFWPSLKVSLKKKLKNSHQIKQFLDRFFQIERDLEKLLTYASHKLDEDLSSDVVKSKKDQIEALIAAFSRETAWVFPFFLSISHFLESWIQTDELKEYRFYLEKMIRLKKHILTLKEEEILALAIPLQPICQNAFLALTITDFIFPKIKDEKNQEWPLTLGNYPLYLRQKDRVLRKNAFLSLHSLFLQHENTFGEFVRGEVKNHHFLTKSRKYASNLEAALFPHQIDTKVYTSLLKTVKEKISVLHQYISFKKELLKLDTFHFYDMVAPASFIQDLQYSYDEAKELVVDSVAPFGNVYQSILKKGLFEEGWVDPFENQYKKSGAYSGGCYDSYPYILMNFQNRLQDVLTLAHEAGHSMHSYFSRKNQSYHNASYPIFVAEVASTLNELLMIEKLLTRSQKPIEKLTILLHQLDTLQATFFRQVLFADFELEIHQIIEKDEPLTLTTLKDLYANLYRFYYGPDLTLDPEINMEWGRIPHFYYGFYVYQYATGIAAALELYQQMNENFEKSQNILDFLSSGGSSYPLDILKKAGVDLTESKSIETFIHFFESRIELVKELCKKI